MSNLPLIEVEYIEPEHIVLTTWENWEDDDDAESLAAQNLAETIAIINQTLKG